MDFPPSSFSVTAVPGIPEVRAGDDLGTLLRDALARADLRLEPGDILVVASKVIAKADGLRVHTSRDEAIAAETVRVVAERRTGERVTRVVEAAAGPVMAAAGVDESNVGADGGVLLLPRDPDAAAARLLGQLQRALDWPSDAPLGIIVSDTAGRAWRAGVVDFALGSAGVTVIDDHRGGSDADGRELSVTVIAVADAIAAAADLVKGKAGALPVAIVRGLPWTTSSPDVPGARSLVRTGPGDWFRSGPVEAVRDALGVVAGSELSERVGIRALSPEDLGTRMNRALSLALHPLGDAVTGAVTQPVADAATKPATEPATQPATRPATDLATRPATAVMTAGADEQGAQGEQDAQDAQGQQDAQASLQIEGSDAYLLGQAVARVCVALASEDLVATDEWRDGSSVHLLVKDLRHSG